MGTFLNNIGIIPKMHGPITKNPLLLGSKIKEVGNHLKETGNKHLSGEEDNNGQISLPISYSLLNNPNSSL